METYIQRRREAAGAAWDLSDEVVLVGAGDYVRMPGRFDQVYPFRAHPEFFYLADHERPGSVLAFDPDEGWTDFAPQVTPEERVWTGGEMQGPADALPRSALEAWLEARKGRPLARLGCPVQGTDPDEELGGGLGERLAALRRVKDEEELRRMREAARATAAGFEAVRGLIRPGLTERRVEVEIQAAMFRAGGDRIAFETIVAGGPRAAVLHAMPSERVLGRGEMVLIDAGVECRGYAADVSRTWPVDGRFSAEQADLYAVVLETVRRATALCRAGTEFRDVHLAACEVVARGLADFGLLRGDPGSLVEQDVPALFFPHGIGHMVGLGVRGAGGRLPGREPGDRPCLEYLRTDLPLEAGFTVTVEPGIYFIPALLEDPDRRKRWAGQVDWDRVDRMLGFGGIRIEDNVLVTGGEPEVLTSATPKEI